MTDQTERPIRARRTRQWLGATFGAVGVVFTLYLMFSLEWVVGVEPSGSVDRTGIAQVDQCERRPASLWMTYACKAKVRWDEAPQGQDHLSTTTIISVSELSGIVPVDQFKYAKGRYSFKVGYSVVPADRPTWPFADGWWVLLVFVSMLPGYLLGFAVGRGIDRLLPEPKEKPKNWRGVNRRRTSGMNGPRRYKRKRG